MKTHCIRCDTHTGVVVSLTPEWIQWKCWKCDLPWSTPARNRQGRSVAGDAFADAVEAANGLLPQGETALQKYASDTCCEHGVPSHLCIHNCGIDAGVGRLT